MSREPGPPHRVVASIFWHNLLLPCTHPKLSHGNDPVFIAQELDTYCYPIVRADEITRVIAQWMAEAALPDVPDAITLVLDGDPVPEHTAKIFQEVVQRDAAWQLALDRTITLEAGAQPADVFYKRASLPFHTIGFPDYFGTFVRAARAAASGATSIPAAPGTMRE